MTTQPEKADQPRNPKFRETTFSPLCGAQESSDCLFPTVPTQETFPTCYCSLLIRDVSLPARLLQGERGCEGCREHYKGAMHRRLGSTAQQSGKTLSIPCLQPAVWAPPQSYSQLCQSTYFIRGNLTYFLFILQKAGDPFSLSNKMSIDTAPTEANQLYLVYFKTHI